MARRRVSVMEGAGGEEVTVSDVLNEPSHSTEDDDGMNAATRTMPKRTSLGAIAEQPFIKSVKVKNVK